MRKATAKRRANGEGSIYPTPRGWRAAITFEDPNTGLKRRRYVQAKSQQAVRERLTELRRGIDLGDVPLTGAQTLGEYLDGWLGRARLRVRPSTWRSHEGAIRLYIKPVLGPVALRALRPSQVEAMTGRLSAAGKARTAHSARATLRTALADAERDGRVLNNAARLARAPKVQKQSLTVLTPEQVRTLVDGTVDDEHGPLLAVLTMTGMRVGEALGLRWDDVSADGSTLHVQHAMSRSWDGGWELAATKTSGSRRAVFLAPSAADAIRRQRARQAQQRLAAGPAWTDDGYVFCDRLGRPLDQRRVWGALRSTTRRLGLPDLRVHDLRHSTATLLLSQGVSVKTVANILGHSSPALVLSTYGGVLADDRKAAAAVIERTMSG